MTIFEDTPPFAEADPAPAPGRPGLLTINQAAALFHRTPRTLRNWRKRGWLLAVRIGGGLYFREADIEALLASGPTNAQADDGVAPGITLPARSSGDAL